MNPVTPFAKKIDRNRFFKKAPFFYNYVLSQLKGGLTG